MSWLRRLSRDRSSKIEPDFQPADHQIRPQTATYGDSKRHYTPTKDSQYPTTPDMLRRPHQDPHGFGSPTGLGPGESDDGGGGGGGGGSGGGGVIMGGSGSGSGGGGGIHSASMAPAPDPLTRAFNEALRPFQERLSVLQSELDAANAQIQTLESEKAAMHNWIDKRGLRPDLPPELSSSIAENSPVAASTLATQLDRKMTMLNFSLHQLADSLPDPLPAYTVSNILMTVLRQIKYLNTLPSGAPFAFESLIKLAGNFNSHHAGDESEEGRGTIEDFYINLDHVMSNVVKKRLAIGSGDENWEVWRDVKRLEKTAAFLKKELGIQHYFSRSLDLMRRESHSRGNEEGLTRYSEESR